MFTWNLPALTRNGVIFTLVCIGLNWNLLAWLFILFIIFAEMDEELTKYENYSDYYNAQLQLYDFSKVSNNGWNLEEQLRIFNQQNPEVVQQYQRTFNSRIQELRKHPTKTKPQDKATRVANRKEKARIKQEVFGYTENYWDEQETLPTNEYVEVINHISSNSMYEWYHQNGLIIPEQEYGIKNIYLYQDKYTDINEDLQYKLIAEQSVEELYTSYTNKSQPNLAVPQGIYTRNIKIAENEKKQPKNNLLYWTMSGYQKAKYNHSIPSVKIQAKYKDKRINTIKHIKQLNSQPWLVDPNPKHRLQAHVIKQMQIPIHSAKVKYFTHSDEYWSSKKNE